MRVLSVLLVLFVTFAYSQTSCQTLYSFESGVGNWIIDSTTAASGVSSSTMFPTSGVSSLRLAYNQGSQAIFKDQTTSPALDVTGYRYFQFDLNIPVVGSIASVGFFVDSNEWTEATPVAPISGQGTYTFDLQATTWKKSSTGWAYTGSVSGIGSIQKIGVILYTTSGTNNFAYLDNVRKCLAGAAPSNSVSPSRTPSISVSRSRTPSISVTASKSKSPVPPPTSTATSTGTSTATATRSAATLSRTPTISVSPSRTPSISVSRSKTPTPSNTRSALPTGPGAGFVYACGTAFCKDGCKFYYAGTNIYYLIYYDNTIVTSALDTAVSIGANVVRTWAFLEGGGIKGTNSYNGYSLQYSTGYGDPTINYGDFGLNHLDDVIYLAKQKGVKLILTLADNWRSFGGIDQYSMWWGLDKHDNFFTDSRVKGSYKRWISTVLNRINHNTGVAYKDENAIMAWELINEPRCAGGGLFYTSGSCTNATISNWVLEMSDYVRSIDTKHLIGVGDEGFFNRGSTTDWTYNSGIPEGGVDFDAYLTYPNINFGTFHMYPDAWGKSATTWCVQWINDHAASSVAKGKPVILEEYGWYNDGNRPSYFTTWLDAVKNSGLAGSNFWMLGVPNAPGDNYLLTTSDTTTLAAYTTHKNAMLAKNTCP